jgi:hypothetical protein
MKKFDEFINEEIWPHETENFINVLEADEALTSHSDKTTPKIRDMWYDITGIFLAMNDAPYLSALPSEEQETLLRIANYLKGKVRAEKSKETLKKYNT